MCNFAALIKRMNILYKRVLFFIILITVTVNNLSACDLCGCSSGNYFLGPSPQFGREFIGLRYSFRSFKTVLANDNKQYSNDFYQTTELWGGFKIKRKIEILAFVPFNINRSSSDDGVKSTQGLGDITVICNYNLVNNESLCKDTTTMSQRFAIGAGVKVPTGKFSVDPADIVTSANNQSGTGSFDFLFSTSYSVIHDKWGLTSELSYKINQSASDYKFGNRFDAAAFAFHSFHKKENTISPNVGLLYENLNPNQLSETDVPSTGGYALLGAMGVESRFDKITAGFNIQYPLLENISDGQTKINLRGMLHLTYAF